MRLARPFVLAGGITLACLATAFAVLFWALSQPTLGLDLAVPSQGAGLRIVAVDRPELAELAGARLLAIAAPGGPDLALDRQTLIEEPDKLNDDALIRAFRADQDRLRAVLAGEVAKLLLQQDGQTRRETVPVQPGRPFGDLPAGFWAQVLTGVAGALIGGWIWAMNPRRASHVFLALTALGLFVSALSAALYSSRELALTERAYEVLAPLNSVGALLFGGGLIALFLTYPRRLLSPRLSLLPLVLLLAPLLVNVLTGIGNPVIFLHLPIVLALTGILALLATQWICARRDPLARAALKLVGLGIVVGAGGFVLTTTLPALVGRQEAVSQAFSFPLFLLVFAGVALAVRRYRFFDLERWSFRLLYYVVGGMILVLLDAFLVFSVSSDHRPLLAAALVVFLLVYLPLRDALARLFFARRGKAFPLTALVRAADAIALARDPARQEALWKDLLVAEFAPLAVEPCPGATALDVRIEEEGAALSLPATPPLPAFRLRWKDQGRSLFSPEDRRKAEDILAILKQLVEGRQAFEAGMYEERERIARDVHDNIGIRLTAALGQAETAHKDDLIRETFTDIRRILTQGQGGAVPMADVVADLRAELGDYLDAHGIRCRWPLPECGEVALSAGVAHALRSFLRESVHNAARHSGADLVGVDLRLGDQGFRVAVWDSGAGGGAGAGRGRAEPRVQSLIGEGGNGLRNLRLRVSDVGGRMQVTQAPGQGFRIEADMPFVARRAEQAEQDAGASRAATA
ncbi:sensor histidine kinase [Pseudooceanicola sp. 200-1SW]|uniref:sensor histidine kinase n=1 Tax=Pseudooceanicola sp. 200-1SW TaxID=3425949 RepID=UPI003D7F5575